MKLICFFAVVLALCAGAQATTSFDLVKGSPVSVNVKFDRRQIFEIQTLSPIVVSFSTAGRRHLLDLTPPANMSSISGAAEILPLLRGSSNSTVAGRHLLQNPNDIPITFDVPVSLKKSALGGFVSAAVDLSGADTIAVLTFFSQIKLQVPGISEAVANAQILFIPSVTGSEFVDIIGTDYFLGSDGKGRMENFGFKGDVSTVQIFTAESTPQQTGAIFLAFEIQVISQGQFQIFQALIPAIDFTVEKASLPTVHGIVDTLC